MARRQFRLIAASLGNCSPELDGKFRCDLAVPHEVIGPLSIQSRQPDEFRRSDSSLTLFDGGHCRPSAKGEPIPFGHICPVHPDIGVRDLSRVSIFVSNRFSLDLKKLQISFCKRFPRRI